MPKVSESYIKVIGARVHNLKNVDVTIPRDKLTVITGLSGSGKSSLAFDTIYAEGQRRYVESLSSYARMFLGQMDKPDVDQIEGLSPAISIDQKSTSRNPRSTVATVTETYDYLRLLFARLGVPHCPICGKVVAKRTAQSIIDEIMKLGPRRVYIDAPLARQKKGEFAFIPDKYMQRGYARARVDGVVYALDEWPELDKKLKHDVDLVVDRLVLNDNDIARISQSIEQALLIGEGTVVIIDADSKQVHTYSERYACVDHPSELIPALEPRLFSFNAPFGACPTCGGLGSRMEIDPDLVLNPNLTIMEGAIRPYNRTGVGGWWQKRLAAVAERHGFDLRTEVKDLPQSVKDMILYGTGDDTYTIQLDGTKSFRAKYEGVIPGLEKKWQETDSDFVRKDIERFMHERECAVCHGARLKPVVQAITVHDLSIVDICSLSIDDAIDVFNAVAWTEQEMTIGRQIFKEIKSRLSFMKDVGLGYLELGRAANTLSGGEAQRIRLATQIGSGLRGVLYVLDEPSIGLHQRDNDRLIATLKHLRDLGNTVIVVEHDEDTIRSADYLVDVGPGAGANGGQIVAAGTPEEVAANPSSLTGRFLCGKEKIAVPTSRRPVDLKRQLIVRGAREHNLKNIDVAFPLGTFTVVSGVSGSGKSTLVNDILSKELSARLNRSKSVAGAHQRIDGIDLLDKVITIDQSPIGRTPRSNPATYTGVFGAIRDLFAATPEANIRGYQAGRISFNVRGGRCEHCQGDGTIKIEMHFLPDIYVTCEECHGARYNKEALEIKWHDKNISEVLKMTIDEAAEFFSSIPVIYRKLKTLQDVGLGYIKLGQSATTFSGGEAQRIKLATELSRKATGKTLYIMDEPTTGLHSADVRRLLDVIQQLVDAGNSVLVIEHNLDVIKSADWVIDMGPDGGLDGGRVVAAGTPEQVAATGRGYTAKYLQKMLDKK